MRRKPQTVRVCLCNRRWESLNADITNRLTTVMSVCDTLPMFQDSIGERMKARLRAEVIKINEIREQLQNLSQYYHDYLDLQKDGTERVRRVETLVGIIGSEDWEARPGKDFVRKQIDKMDLDTLRRPVSVWEAMREYLSYVPEARIAEMEEFFVRVGFADGNRQAMESALKHHKNVFAIRKQKREKYISLK